METRNTDYKWIDIERENRTTDNPIYWIKGFVIIVVFYVGMFSLLYVAR